MHTAANLAHINAETERYLNEQAKNCNPFAEMDPTGELFKQANKPREPQGLEPA